MLKVALLAPIRSSLYSRLVADAVVNMEGVELCAIVVRNHLNWARLKSELGRDGVRLLGKIQQKYVLGDERFETAASRNLGTLAEQCNLEFKSLKELASRGEIPYLVVNDLNSPKVENLLKKQAPDLIAFTGGGLIRKNILCIPKIGVMNCHTGILPQYRGMDVVEWTAVEGKIKKVGFGATLHLMDQGVDTGPILLKKIVSPLATDDFKIIREKLEVAMVELMIAGIQKFKNQDLQPQAQNPADGRQYYVMHPRIKVFAERQLKHQMRSIEIAENAG
jgi:methionyl-tRNA formyltransferase